MAGQVVLASLALWGCRSGEGPEVEASGPARRVVALAPNLASIVADVGGADRLVGISSFGAVPEGTEGVERVGGFVDPSIERIIALRPDLVVGVPLQRRALASCRASGLATLELDSQTIDSTLEAYGTLGERLGRAEAAAEAARALRLRLERVQRRAGGGAQPRTLLLLGRAGEDLQRVYPVAPGTFTHELLVIAGGHNVIERAAPSLSVESVIALAPEVIVEIAMDEPGARAERRLPISPMWSRLESIPAVRDGRVYAVESAALLQPGPRMGRGAELLRQLLQGSQPSSS